MEKIQNGVKPDIFKGVWGVFGVCGVCRVFRVFRVLVVGFNFGFGRTKTTRNVTWGSILTYCRKIHKNS